MCCFFIELAPGFQKLGIVNFGPLQTLGVQIEALNEKSANNVLGFYSNDTNSLFTELLLIKSRIHTWLMKLD